MVSYQSISSFYPLLSSFLFCSFSIIFSQKEHNLVVLRNYLRRIWTAFPAQDLALCKFPAFFLFFSLFYTSCHLSVFIHYFFHFHANALILRALCVTLSLFLSPKRSLLLYVSLSSLTDSLNFLFLPYTLYLLSSSCYLQKVRTLHIT